MHDATVDRLIKLVSAEQGGSNGLPNKNTSPPRKLPFRLHLELAEGWFSLFLLATVLYSTIWCVEAAGWVDHLTVLSLITALGIISGLLTAKQRRFPPLIVHLVMVAFALVLSLWQTAGAFYDGSIPAVFHNLGIWITLAENGGTSGDDSIFLLLISALSFLLAYTSVWLVYRLRSPWLMIVANAVVLLINLSYIPLGYTAFLVVFLVASLLLLLRFNLYDSVMLWRKQRLRFPDDLGWDFMQAGALISIGIVVFAWLLPSGYIDQDLSQVWNGDASPWVAVQDTWNRLFFVNGNIVVSNHGSFRNSLTLAGNPHLNNEVVMLVKTDDKTQYLAALSYDTYSGKIWTNTSVSTQVVKGNQFYNPDTTSVHTINQAVKIINAPGEQSPYILGASQVAMVNQDTQLINSSSSNQVVAWLRSNGPLSAGSIYTVVSDVSSADIGTLRQVPFPAQAPRFASNYDGPVPASYYDPAVLATYTQLPKDLDPNILKLAQSVTAQAKTPYDKMHALEDYLHSNYTYDVNINRPMDQEGVSWFLFRSDHRGFCNYFAAAMTVMARELGMPARVVVGYTHGIEDTKAHQQVIRGVDAHAWTQVYFAGYGWINFEPSASFNSFDRPQPNQFSTGSSGLSNSSSSLNSRNNPGRRKNPFDTGTESGSSSSGTSNAPVSLQQEAGMFFGGVVVLVLIFLLLFSIWWRQLFRNRRMAVQMYGRICLLAEWAGIQVQPSKTPLEHINELSEIDKAQAEPLKRFGDIYVRDLWANPESVEHPQRSGEVSELPGLWKNLQAGLFSHVLRHPYFLLKLPQRLVTTLRGNVGQRKRVHQQHDIDVQEEMIDERDLEALG